MNSNLVNNLDIDNTDPQTFFRYFRVKRLEMEWGLQVLNVGEARVLAGQPYPGARHPEPYNFGPDGRRTLHEFQFVYISAGRGWFEADGVPLQRVESGDAFIVFPGVWHRYAPDPQAGWDEHWVGFNGDRATGLIEAGFFSAENPTIKLQSEPKVLQVFTSMLDAARGAATTCQPILASLTEYLLALTYASQSEAMVRRSAPGEKLEKAITLMGERINTDMDVEKLAEELGVSYAWFRQNFVRHTGLSPQKYFIKLRVAMARGLLADKKLSVRDVAIRAGFSNEFAFSRVFRQKTGLTPRQWRQQSEADDSSAADQMMSGFPLQAMDGINTHTAH